MKDSMEEITIGEDGGYRFRISSENGLLAMSMMDGREKTTLWANEEEEEKLLEFLMKRRVRRTLHKILGQQEFMKKDQSEDD